MTAEDLKKSILQEAIQGKLVPQIASEGTGKELLEKILKEKTQLIKEGKIKKEKSLEPISEDEIPFDIPASWCWCRLGEIVKIKSGDGLTASQMVEGEIPVFGGNGITGHHNKFNINQEKIIIGRVGFYCGSIHIAPEKSWITDNAFITDYPTNYINKYYLVYLLKILNLGKDNNGTAQPVVSGKKIYPILMPLPPLAEQQRIVDAIEKFMPLVEEYGKREIKLNSLNEIVGEKTKKAILQEAISGVLTEGWRKNNKISETGKDLLEKILKEKTELIKAKKFKKEKPLKPIKEDEIPFDIPESWCWCNVGELFTTMSGLGYKKDLLAEKSQNMIRVLRGGNILDTSYIFKDDDIMISSDYVKKELLLKTNYLITPAVTSLEHIGKIARIDQDYEDTVVGGFVLMIIPYLNNETLSKYCLYLFSSHWFRCLCKDITHKSGQAFYNLSRDKLINLCIPLPPLEEQKQIVKTIEVLLPLCDKLGK